MQHSTPAMALQYQQTKASAEIRSKSGRLLGIKDRLLGRYRSGSSAPQPVSDLGLTTAEVNAAIQQTQQTFRTYKRSSSSQRSAPQRSSPNTSSPQQTSGSGGTVVAADKEVTSRQLAVREGDAEPARQSDSVDPKRKAAYDDWLQTIPRSPMRK